MSSKNTPSPPDIDYGAALQRGLDKIAATEPNSGSTEHLRQPGEHRAPVRTEPVEEVSISLEEFVEMTAPKKHRRLRAG